MTAVADQYRIVAASAGWVERVDRGRLRFDGNDRSSFLQGIVTNDVHALQPGQGVYAAYLTPQGRMLSDLRLHHWGSFLLAEVPASQAAALADRFDQLIFSEDVRVADVSSQIAQVTVIGPQAASVLTRALGLDPSEAPLMAAMPALAHRAAGDVTIARGDDVELPSFDVFVDASARAGLLSRVSERGITECSFELLDALRVEAGRPVYGVDMTAETIPLEAGLLERAISTTKGCYVGQEILIRMLHRGGGRVAKRLSRLRFDAGVTAPPPPGTPLLHDGREVGRVTSAVVSPVTGGVIGLGYVHRDHAEMGTRLTAGTDAAGALAEIVGFAG